jgi:hypothetical protein
MAAWWAKAYEGLEVRLAASRRGCALLRCDAMRCDAMRGLDGSGSKWPFGPLRLDCGAARGVGEAQRARARARACGRGAVWAEATEGGAGAARLSCAGVCGRWMRCEGAAQGITAWRGRRIELWLQTAGGGRVVAVAVAAGRAPWCTGMAPTNRSRSVAVPGELRARCQVGLAAEWVRVRYDSRAGQRRRGSGSPGGARRAGGAGASTAVNEDQARLRPRPRPRRSAQRHKNEQ